MESFFAKQSVFAPTTVGAVLAANLLFYSYFHVPSEFEQIRQIDARESAALSDIEAIKVHGAGHAACEMLNLCYWAHSDFMMDFFYFGQKLKTDAVPGTTCADVFEHRNIALVQLVNSPSARAKLLPKDCDELIVNQYRQIRRSSSGLLLTRPTGAVSRPADQSFLGPGPMARLPAAVLSRRDEQAGVTASLIKSLSEYLAMGVDVVSAQQQPPRL